jgi:hypothetical protein
LCSWFLAQGGVGMDTTHELLEDFGEKNFGQAQFGDRRRTKRLVRVSDQIARHPAGTLPDKMKSPANLKALYRLVRSDRVTHAAVLEPARQRTLERMRATDGVVLVIHDGTELDYTNQTSLKRLGQIGNGGGRGYICHNSLAVRADSREVLGLANQILFRRPKVDPHETKEQSRRRINRESRLWKRGAEAIGPAPVGSFWVDVCDRAADISEYLDYKHQQGQHYVVRSQHNRKIYVGPEKQPSKLKLHDFARTLPELGRRQVDVPGSVTQAARTAQVRIGAAEVWLKPPRQKRGDHGNEPLQIWVVYVGEIEPPPEVEPLEWILLTDVPTWDFQGACERIRWYECRPIIEEFHKGQKSGCGIETMQFEYEERLEPAIALLSVTAVLLLQLRDICRRPEAQTRPATEVVPPSYVEVVSVWRYGKKRTLSVAEFCYAVARLGGHQNRKSDGAPGWITLWRGWTKLQLMVEAVTIMRHCRSG